MTEHDDALSLDMVTAALRADSTDVAIYARVLAQSLGEALPPTPCRWSGSGPCPTGCAAARARSPRSRPGSAAADDAGGAERQGGGRDCRAVRGVVLSRQTVPVGEWAATLASALVGYAEQNAQAAQALRKLVAGG